MQTEKYLPKFTEDSSKHKENNSLLTEILESWKEIKPYEYTDVVINNPTKLSKHILLLNGPKSIKYINFKKINTKSKLLVCLDYWETVNINTIRYADLKKIQEFLTKTLTENKKKAEAHKDSIKELNTKIVNRLNYMKSLELVCISVGDHEHGNYSDYYFYSNSTSIEIQKAYDEGSTKISFDFLNDTIERNEDRFSRRKVIVDTDFDDKYDGMLNSKEYKELKKLGYICDDSSYSETLDIYLFIAKLGNDNLECYELSGGIGTIGIEEYRY